MRLKLLLFLMCLITLCTGTIQVEAAGEEYEKIPDVKLKDDLLKHPDVNLKNLSALPSRLQTIVDNKGNYYFCLDESKYYPNNTTYSINSSQKIDPGVSWLVKNFYEDQEGTTSSIASYDKENFYTKYAATQIAIWNITNSIHYEKTKAAYTIISENPVVSDLVDASKKATSADFTFSEGLEQINNISTSLTDLEKVNTTDVSSTYKTTLKVENINENFYLDQKTVKTKVSTVNEKNNSVDITKETKISFDNATNEITLEIPNEYLTFETNKSSVVFNIEATIRSKQELYVSYEPGSSPNTQPLISKNKISRLMKDTTQITEEQKTAFTVVKRWDDNEDQDGMRTGRVQVQLYQNGTAFGEPQILDNSNNWTYTWINLQEFDASGNRILYEAKEVTTIPGYETEYVNQDKDSVEIVNVHNVEYISLQVVKKWEDMDDAEGIRPKSIKVDLYADDELLTSTYLTSDDWTHEFKDLPKYNNGKEIHYHIEEVDVDERYESKVDGMTITNTYKPNDLTQVSVKKVWKDNNDQDGKRPKEITVELYANDVATGEIKELNESNDWKANFVDLIKDEEGKLIKYTVVESTVEEYEATYTYTEESEESIVITNTYSPQVKDIPVNKVWVDENDQDGKRPESITVNLLANGIKVDEKKLTEENNWSHVFENYPVYEDGKEIKYTLTENSVEDYSTQVKETTITNTYTPGKTSITVTKTWDDSNDQARIRPKSIKVQLYADDEEHGEPVVLSSEDDWTYTWTDLDVKKEGTEISYTVKELDVPEEYEVSIDAADLGNIIITNSYTPILRVDGMTGGNKRNTVFPATGETQSMYYLLLGGILLVAAGTIVFYQVKRKNKV